MILLLSYLPVATSSNSDCVRDTKITFTPSFANAIAIAFPIPFPAPVIRAFYFFKSVMLFFLFWIILRVLMFSIVFGQFYKQSN
jgi:hypothetical protein